MNETEYVRMRYIRKGVVFIPIELSIRTWRRTCKKCEERYESYCREGSVCDKCRIK